VRTIHWPKNWYQEAVRLRGRLRLDAFTMDELDAGLRGLAVGIVSALSIFGYTYTPLPDPLVRIPPTMVAAALIAYNAAVVLVLGVPWRRRPGFPLYVVDWLVVTAAIVLTGGFFSPFLILYYALVIGAALRLSLPQNLGLVAACSVVYAVLSTVYPTPADTGTIHLPWLVVGVTSLLMVVVTAVAMKRAVDIENTRARLEEQTASRMRLLNDLTRTVLNASPDLAALLRTVAAIAPDTLGADCGLAVLFDRSGQARRVARSDGAEPDLTPGALALALAAGVQGRPIILEDAPHDSRGRDLAAMLGPVTTVACCPLVLDAQPVGALFVASAAPRTFTPAEVSLLSAIAGQTVLPVRLARLYDLEREKAAQADAREQVERDLLNTVSHELRTPLTAIKTSISGLRAAPGAHPPAEERLLQNIDRSTERLILLVNDVLDMARLRAGRVTLRCAPVDLGGLVREASVTVRALADAKGQSLELALPGPAWATNLTVMGDRRRLEQVLLNILHNAIKYTPAGGVIRVGADGDAVSVRVWVRDNGPGIAPADQTHIFERFYVGRGDGGERGDATGLGLAIAHSLIDLHGGSIGVTSQIGAGSTFYFTLPRGDDLPA
jgi:signal transduction histidine kinase